MINKLTITLRMSGSQLEFTTGQQTLLDILEQHQVLVASQCRSGYCGTCRTRLLKGQVTYCQSPLAYLQEGEILPCCCTPLIDIELDI